MTQAKARTTEARGRAPKHRVVVVEDHPLMRRAIVQTLKSEEDIEVSGEASSLGDASALIRRVHPELAIVDITLQDGHGLSLIDQIRGEAPDTKVLVFSLHDEELYAERVIRAGASGYLNKNAPPELLIQAVRRVLEGKMYCSEKTAERMLRNLSGPRPRQNDDPIRRLSDRELEAFELIGRGKTTHQVAEAMSVSHKTIDTYRQRVKLKLGVENNSELARLAVEHVMAHNRADS